MNKLVLVCDNKAKLCCPFTSEIPEWSDLLMGAVTSPEVCYRDLRQLFCQAPLKRDAVHVAVWL